MRRRSRLSILVSFFLMLGSVAPYSAGSRELKFDETAVVASSNAPSVDGVDERKGNGFVRVISAPFRALGRLFGGGKKKSANESAKKKEVAARAEVSEVSAAGAPPASAVVERRLDEKPEKEKERERKKEQTRETRATGARTHESAAVAAPVDVPRQSGGTRVVRPAEAGALPVQPKWIPVIEGIPKDPLSQGRALLVHGYPNEAVSELSIAAVTGPDLVEANNLLGLAYDRLGMHLQASESYERALSVAPDDPQILNNLGQSLYLAGNNLAALKRLRQAERRAPRAPSVMANIALVQVRLGKYDDAFKSLARAVGEYDARLKTAEMLEQANRPDDAIKHYVAALKLQPNSPALLERLAALYDRTNRQREAEATRRTMSNPPNKQKTATGGGG